MRIPSRSLTHRSAALLAGLLILAVAAPVAAQQAETFGPYEVHYNTLNTNLLTPEVARVYGIQRAGTRAMLNITILDTRQDAAVTGRVSVEAVNLTGQRRQIEMQEIRDQDAIYYIGTFRVHNEENMNFSVEVSPEGHSDAPFAFSFRQQFFTD